MNQFNNQIGAHELLELNEIVMDSMNGINQFQLFLPHCKDMELRSIMENQLNFMVNEYNSILSLLGNKGKGKSLTYQNVQVANIGQQQPPLATQPHITDKDIAQGMLGCAKSTATLRMRAALECADLDLRTMLLQGAKNSADQAYEMWSYMSRKAYYHVPTFSFDTTQQMIDHYGPSMFNNYNG